MVFLGYCIPCQWGRHDEHYEVIRAVPKGVMGGARCRCEGECGKSPMQRVDEQLAEILKHYPAPAFGEPQEPRR